MEMHAVGLLRTLTAAGLVTPNPTFTGKGGLAIANNVKKITRFILISQSTNYHYTEVSLLILPWPGNPVRLLKSQEIQNVQPILQVHEKLSLLGFLYCSITCFFSSFCWKGNVQLSQFSSLHTITFCQRKWLSNMVFGKKKKKKRKQKPLTL